MLIKRRVLGRIAAGEITLAFRRWGRPPVRTGGTLRTAVGVLAIGAVDEIDEASLTDDEARQAGYPSRGALLASLDGQGGAVYRIALRYLQEDPRTLLAADATPDMKELGTLRRRLSALDARSPRGAWTFATLRAIGRSEGVAAAELAAALDVPKPLFKADVRRLKEFGLTESLTVGYRLSPRGRHFLDWLDRATGDPA